MDVNGLQRVFGDCLVAVTCNDALKRDATEDAWNYSATVTSLSPLFF